jgi:hypothetical protein
MNTYLKNDPRPVLDSEVDLVTGPREEVHPIPPEQLRVFPQDSDIPAGARNGRIDREFVPLAEVKLPGEGEFESWKNDLLGRLRTVSFHHFPSKIPAGERQPENAPGEIRLGTEQGISIRLRAAKIPAGQPGRVFLLVSDSGLDAPLPSWLEAAANERDAIYVCEPRGTGGSSWTRKNPPNYVERSHYLLGRTAESGRVWDIAATAGHLRAVHEGKSPIHVAGEGTSAVLAIYAALLEADIAGLLLANVPATHMDEAAPSLLNVLRVCDIPDALGMVAPRPVLLAGAPRDTMNKAAEIYRAAGVPGALTVKRGGRED